MTVDIIVIPLERFLLVKESIVLDPNVSQKYQELLDKYTCFTQQPQASSTPTPINTFTKKSSFAHHHHNKHNNKTNASSYRKPKDFQKVLTGIMNIINQTNFNKMFNKIRLLKSDNNIGTIVQCALTMCSIQSFYLNIYIKLIHDILEGSNEIEKKIILQTINAYINDFLEQKAWCNMKDVDDDYSFYDQQKQKTLIMSKHVMFLELVVSVKQTEFDMQDYATVLFDNLKESIQNKENVKGLLIVSMLISMFKMSKRGVPLPWYPKKLCTLDVDVATLTCKNLQFMLEELSHLQKIEA